MQPACKNCGGPMDLLLYSYACRNLCDKQVAVAPIQNQPQQLAGNACQSKVYQVSTRLQLLHADALYVLLKLAHRLDNGCELQYSLMGLVNHNVLNKAFADTLAVSSSRAEVNVSIVSYPLIANIGGLRIVGRRECSAHYHLYLKDKSFTCLWNDNKNKEARWVIDSLL